MNSLFGVNRRYKMNRRYKTATREAISRFLSHPRKPRKTLKFIYGHAYRTCTLDWHAYMGSRKALLLSLLIQRTHEKD